MADHSTRFSLDPVAVNYREIQHRDGIVTSGQGIRANVRLARKTQGAHGRGVSPSGMTASTKDRIGPPM